MSVQVYKHGHAGIKHKQLIAVRLYACSKRLNTILQGLNFYPTFKDFKRSTLACSQLLPARGSTS